ncbi:hypothetical protein K6119_07770 [Paracrocinitomix mangrovi]|uniref:hypothetical protein n=1 Tax=Paracrocinitomix mangrovi TaxID=2862509 RepID=UPI001C8DC153|nr:hypothetical protein [Paracrocinitomix mangrovi]UKN03411.1 hypothetical protein K6119_07770 [Paracrocinitomix mangrovi]
MKTIIPFFLFFLLTSQTLFAQDKKVKTYWVMTLITVPDTKPDEQTAYLSFRLGQKHDHLELKTTEGKTVYLYGGTTDEKSNEALLKECIDLGFKNALVVIQQDDTFYLHSEVYKDLKKKDLISVNADTYKVTIKLLNSQL